MFPAMQYLVVIKISTFSISEI